MKRFRPLCYLLNPKVIFDDWTCIILILGLGCGCLYKAIPNAEEETHTYRRIETAEREEEKPLPQDTINYLSFAH